MDFKLCFLYLFHLVHFPATRSSLYLTTNASTWQEARSTCTLAKERTVCNTYVEKCNVKLTGSDIIFTENSPVWVDSYLLQTHFIYNYGCRSANINLFDASTVHYKVGPNNDVNECAATCGDFIGYALYDFNCFCVNSTSENYLEEISDSICNIDCRECSYEKCGGEPSSTHYHVTYYKVFKPAGQIQTSCIAVHWDTDFTLGFTFKDCDDKHGFVCEFPLSQNPVFYDFDNSTWEQAKRFCYNLNGHLSDDIFLDASSIFGLKTRYYYWSAYHRRNIYRWDTPLNTNQYGLQGCMALTSRYTLELHDCKSQFQALCGELIVGTLFKEVRPVIRGDSNQDPSTSGKGLGWSPSLSPPSHTSQCEEPETTEDYKTTETYTSSTQYTTDMTSTTYDDTTSHIIETSSKTTSQSTTMKKTESSTLSSRTLGSSTNAISKTSSTVLRSTTPTGDEYTTQIVLTTPSSNRLTYYQSTLIYIAVPVGVMLILFLVVIIVISSKKYRNYRRKKFLRLYSISDNSTLLGNEMFQDLHGGEYSYLPRLEPRVDFIRKPGDDTYDHIRMYRERPKSSKSIQNSTLVKNNSNHDSGATNREDNVIGRDLVLLDLNHARYKSNRSDSLTNYLPMGYGEINTSLRTFGKDSSSEFPESQTYQPEIRSGDNIRYSIDFCATTGLKSDIISVERSEQTGDITQGNENQTTDNFKTDSTSNCQTYATVHKVQSDGKGKGENDS